MEQRRVVVTGLGALTPIGNNVKDFWEGLLAGKSGAGPITYFDTADFKTKFACEVKDFNIEDYLDRKEASRMDPYCQYSMVTSQMALEDSGIDLDNVDKERFGVIYGSGIGGMKFSAGSFAIEKIGLAGILGLLLNLILPPEKSQE